MKPTELKRLEGNPGKKRLGREPQPTGTLTPPPFVTGDALAEWHRATAAMPPNFYKSADAPILAVYATAWITYRDALAAVEREGLTVLTTKGTPMSNPALRAALQSADLILRAADRLGMSPAARTRLAVQDDPPASKFVGLFGGRSDLRLVCADDPPAA
jgi:P27 family predicted phage terminase small subunit